MKNRITELFSKKNKISLRYLIITSFGIISILGGFVLTYSYPSFDRSEKVIAYFNKESDEFSILEFGNTSH